MATDKQKVRDLEKITKSSNEQHLMIITDLDTNQLRKEKISDFLTDTISSDTDNGIKKGTDSKLFMVDTTNADNITSGVLSDERLLDSGVSAGEYPYPVNMHVDEKGRILSVEAGEPGLNNANTDLSNITDAGVEVIKNNTYKPSLFDIEYSDHILSLEESKGRALLGTYVYKTGVSGERYGYPDFYNECLEEKTNGVETLITVGNYTFTGYVNPNKHVFYNIADKEIVDNIYNTTGMAWYYGIDTENERVFLPRNNKYFMNADVDDVGSSVEAGLPNIQGNGLWAKASYISGCVNIEGSDNYGNTSAGAVGNFIGINASLSNPIYGKSNTVQTDAVKLLVYMIVGNTDVDSAITNVIDVTTTENDTLPLGFSFYSQTIQPSVSYLKSSGQWNSGNIYTTFYNWLVNQLNVNENVKEAGDSTITDYDYVVNQADITFRLPLKNGDRALLEHKEAAADVPTWYKLYSDGWLEQGGYIPSQTSDIVMTIRFLKPYSTKPYVFKNYGIDAGATTDAGYSWLTAFDITNTQFKTRVSTNPTDVCWKSEGYAQKPTGYNLYYKVANAVENLQLLDVGAVTDVLADKANRDLSNCTNSAREMITELGMPDYSAGITVASNPFIAPTNGYICGYLQYNGGTANVLINGKTIVSFSSGGAYLCPNIQIPVSKSDSVAYSRIPLTFYPMKGVNND